MPAVAPEAAGRPNAVTALRTNGRGATQAGACPTPHPISEMLPAMFHDDEFVLRFVAGLDDVLAPVLVALDCLWSYIDPLLAPVDFLDWLAGWVGLAADQSWSEERRRALVLQAVDLYRWQGTAIGLSTQVRLCTGADPQIIDPGGVAWSQTPLGPLPGEEDGVIVLRVAAASAGAGELADLEAILAATKPAHVRHRIEVV